jgi:hypothetical protein
MKSGSINCAKGLINAQRPLVRSHVGAFNPPAIALKIAVRGFVMMSGTTTPDARFPAFIARATGK